MQLGLALNGFGHLGCEVFFFLLDAFAHFHADETVHLVAQALAAEVADVDDASCAC